MVVIVSGHVGLVAETEIEREKNGLSYNTNGVRVETTIIITDMHVKICKKENLLLID